MNNSNISVFLPVRKGSERVPFKNTKKFGPFNNGLLELKITQLLGVKEIREIIVSSNDEKCLEIAQSFSKKNSRLKVDFRPDWLARSDTNLTNLIEYARSICLGEHIIWTHVTSPFLNNKNYSEAIKSYFKSLNEGFDSLMTARELNSFIWDNQLMEVINKSGSLQWPRTQDLKLLYEIDSGLFILSRNLYSKYKNRIGIKPFIMETSILEGFDVDWPTDFDLAEKLYIALYGSK